MENRSDFTISSYGEYSISSYGEYYGLLGTTQAHEAVIVVAANGEVFVHGRLVEQSDAEREKMRDVFNPRKMGKWDAPASGVSP